MARPDASDPKKILLLPMCGLGDAVCYLPTLALLRSRFPTAEIVAVVATEPAGVILQSNQNCVEVIVFNRGNRQKGLKPLFQLLRAIRRRRFDVVISGAHPDSTRVPLFSFLCGARLRIGARSERLSFLYNRRVNVTTDAHYFDRYRLLLTGLGMSVSRAEFRPTMNPPPSAKDSAERLWSDAGLDGAEVVIGLVSGADVNARGRWQPYLKRWNTHSYAEVAKWAHANLSARLVMIGSASEAYLADEIAAISGVPIASLCGKTSLQDVQWILSKCTAVISNDTGTMHMAGAVGAKLLALFGPTSPASFSPPGEHNLIIQGHAPCSPCYPHPTCNLEKCLAMDNISSAQVIVGISELLSAGREAQSLITCD